MEAIFIVAGVIIAGILAVLGIVRANLKICQPNEVLIFSGKQRQIAGGSSVGFRVIRGGRGFRVPIIEKVDRLSLNTIPIDLTVTNAYSKGGIPLMVRAIANVKVASTEPELNNAVERLLGKKLDEIQQIAKETLEGNLRGVLALLTPEEVNEDRLKFAKELLDEADNDLSALGLQLDTLKIQSVEDDRGYLDAIGRQQTAHIISAAEIAEAQKEEQARTAQARADKTIAQAENEVRIIKAQLAATSEAEEAKVSVAARLAGALAEQELAEQEILLAEKRQRASVVIKAEAERQAKEEIAKGNAARILEDGHAEVEVLRQKLALWQQAGPDAEQLFLIQMLPDVLKEIVKTVDHLKIDRLTVVDGGGSGQGVPAVMSQIAGTTPAILESLKTSTGVDIAGLLRRAGERSTDAQTDVRPDAGEKKASAPKPSGDGAS
ncbi:MAG: flotillin family protein [Rhodothermales bacterium]